MNQNPKVKTATIVLLLMLALLFLYPGETAEAQPFPVPGVEVEEEGEPLEIAGYLQLLLLLAVLTLAPAFVVLMTSFTRMVVVLGFVRNAVGTQQIPPNQVLIGLALFMTFFIMFPRIEEINENALQPYMEEEITQEEAIEEGIEPLREFMLEHVRDRDLALFLDIAEMEPPEDPEGMPMQVLVPSFVVSELRTAFEMGFRIFVPFLIIDMVVASTLMSMGMFMLPPVIVSLPFKILLFVLVDGWHLVVRSLLESFA